MGLTQSSNRVELSGMTLQFDASARDFCHAQSAAEAVHAPPRAEVDLHKASDDALVTEAKAGDQTAFVDLCDRYSLRLKQRIFRIVRNQEDTEDVFQETLMRAYKHLNGFRGSCSFQTWITQIAINTALTLLRWRRTCSEMGFEIIGEGGEIVDRWEFPDPSPNPEQLYLRRQTCQMLSNAVTRLPSSFRPIVEQVHGNELKLIDAAQALGLKEGAAKSRLLRARALLRRRLKNQYPGRREGRIAICKGNYEHSPTT